MPIYEFDCHDCGVPFESLVIGFSTDKVKCPHCESKEVKKKISTFAVKAGSAGTSAFNSNAYASSCSTGST